MHAPKLSLRDHLVGMTLTVVIIFAAIALVAWISRANESGGFTVEGGRDPVPAASASETPSTTPPGNPPKWQQRATVAFVQLPMQDRIDLCGFLDYAPQDAVQQGVRAGLKPKDARRTVRFVVEELCL